MPGRFAFGVARRDGTLDDVLRKIDAASQEMKRREDRSLLQLAIDATGKDDVENRKPFAKVMMGKEPVGRAPDGAGGWRRRAQRRHEGDKRMKTAKERRKMKRRRGSSPQIPCFSDHARARARRRPFTEAEIAAWRERFFGETLNDPVKIAVEAANSWGDPDGVKIAVEAANSWGDPDGVKIAVEAANPWGETPTAFAILRD